jgi:hypothetical protein
LTTDKNRNYKNGADVNLIIENKRKVERENLGRTLSFLVERIQIQIQVWSRLCGFEKRLLEMELMVLRRWSGREFCGDGLTEGSVNFGPTKVNQGSGQNN